jgi:protein O-mannosyl-transferase
MKRWTPAVAIVALALVSSVSSLGNRFAYDDLPIISENAPLHDLSHIGHRFVESYWPMAQGHALYRPLTTVIFTLEWVIGHGSPLPFHIVNVALYVLVCVAVYALALRLLSPTISLIVAALYAVDPVHVEVFANSVGLSELITALTVIGATMWYIDRRRAGHLGTFDIVVLATLYALGCLAKEYAIVLPAILLAAELTVLGGQRPWRELRVVTLVLALVGVAYLALRIQVIGTLVGENPAIPLRNATYATRFWTFLGVVPDWVRLLVWPSHLAALYSPPGTPVLQHVDVTAATGAAVLLLIAVLAIASRKQMPVAAFGIAWIGLILLPVSDVVVKSGVLLAERTLFLPSVGAALVLGAILTVAAARFPSHTVRMVAAVALVCVLGAAAWRSATHALVWKDNTTLFAASVADEPLSYAAHFGQAGLAFTARDDRSGEREALTAIRLYDGDARVYAALASEYERTDHCAPALAYARAGLALSPHFVIARLIIAKCLAKAGDYAALHSIAVQGIADGYQQSLFRQILFTADSGARAASAGRH